MRYVRANDRWAPGVGSSDPHRAGAQPSEGHGAEEPSNHTQPGPPLLAPTLGTWFNCNPRTGEIVRLVLAERGDGLRLRCFGADDADPIDWGETPAQPHVSALDSREVTGFTARYEFGFMETQIAANIKYGVLVIQSYNRFLDGSRRPPYFTREFFHQRLDKPPAGALAPTDVAAALPYRMAADRLMTAPRGRGAVDLGPLLGRWHNTNPNTKGIASVVLERAADAYEIGATGVSCDEDWGRVPAIPHAAHVSGREPAGFLARFDFGFSEVLFSANEAKGLLIIASFTTFRDDSGRSSYFTREFFYREDGRTDTP